MIHSLLCKRVVSVEGRDLLPIYADVRDEFACLLDHTNMSADQLGRDLFDAFRHSVGLFASIYLRCPRGLGPDVGEVVYFNSAQENTVSSVVSLGKVPGIDFFIHSNDVMESCDGEWEDYERIELSDSIIR